MVTWHLTMKLFPAKCHERATLQKLWRQTGNSSLLPAKCWPLLHVISGISARFSNFAFVLFCYITNHLVTGPLGNSEFCFPRISMLPKTKLREIVRFESPGDVRTGEKRKAQVTKRSHKRRGENRKWKTGRWCKWEVLSQQWEEWTTLNEIFPWLSTKILH